MRRMMWHEGGLLMNFGETEPRGVLQTFYDACTVLLYKGKDK